MTRLDILCYQTILSREQDSSSHNRARSLLHAALNKTKRSAARPPSGPLADPSDHEGDYDERLEALQPLTVRDLFISDEEGSDCDGEDVY